MHTAHRYAFVRVLGVTLLFMGLSIGRPAEAQFTFVKVADTSTWSPDLGSVLGNIHDLSFSAGHVAFLAQGGPFAPIAGVFTDASGSLHAVATTETWTSALGSTFHDIHNLSFSDEHVAFLAQGGPFAPIAGVFTDAGGSLHAVATTETWTSALGSPLGNIHDLSFSAGHVAFLAQGGPFAPIAGVFTDAGGSLHAVATTETWSPDLNSNITNLGNLSLSAGHVAFTAVSSRFGSEAGVFTDAGGSLHTLATTNTWSSEFNGYINNFSNLSLSDEHVAFVADSSRFPSEAGIFTDVGGSLHTVATTNTWLPEFNGYIKDFGGLSLSDGHVAFQAQGRYGGQEGILTDLGGSLSMVVEQGDYLDGQEVASAFSPEIDGDQIAFLAAFTDGAEGVFVATPKALLVPESDSLSLILGSGFASICVAGLCHRRQRR